MISQKAQLTGLRNFEVVLTSSQFPRIVVNTFISTVAFVVLLSLKLLTALMLNQCPQATFVNRGVVATRRARLAGYAECV
ncbi:MAG: hypothetical protein NZ693_10640 [Thermoflexales bacterium]|nr:hypothetical protein [Thermoflexales bacterium]